MVLLILSGVLTAVMCWLLLSPLTVMLDTRVPELFIRWKGIMAARLVYDGHDPWLYLQFLFIRHRWRLGAGKRKSRRTDALGKTTGIKRRKSKMPGRLLPGMVRVVKSFRIAVLEIAIDTGNPVTNAQIFPLNFLPYPSGRSVYVNFEDRSFLVIRAGSTLWRMLKAWLLNSD